MKFNKEIEQICQSIVMAEELLRDEFFNKPNAPYEGLSLFVRHKKEQMGNLLYKEILRKEEQEEYFDGIEDEEVLE